MPTRTQTLGKVFDLELNQSNQPSINDAWGKFGKQSSSQTKMEEFQRIERARQDGATSPFTRGTKPTPTKAVRAKFKVPKKGGQNGKN